MQIIVWLFCLIKAGSPEAYRVAGSAVCHLPQENVMQIIVQLCGFIKAGSPEAYRVAGSAVCHLPQEKCIEQYYLTFLFHQSWLPGSLANSMIRSMPPTVRICVKNIIWLFRFIRAGCPDRKLIEQYDLRYATSRKKMKCKT